MHFWNDTVFPALSGVFADVIGILPNLLGALSILIIGWILAGLLRRVVSRLLDKVGFNGLAERAGIAGFLERSGFAKPPSWVIGQLIFWMVLLTFLLSAAENLKLGALVNTLQSFVAFIPNLITVAFMLVFGVVLANFVGKLVQGAASEAGMEIGGIVSKIVSNLIILIVVVIAISQLKIESSVLLIVFGALLGAFGLAIALTLGFGTRNIANNIISGVYARKIFSVGQTVRVNNVEGEIIDIGTASTVIKSGKKTIAMPNHMLIENVTEHETPDS